jgi:hypothetical protein
MIDPEFVYCVECEKHGRTGTNRKKISKTKLETNQWSLWTCSECAKSRSIIDLTLMDFISQRIQVHGSEDEDESKFVFRELLQNADDEESNILVLRFEDQALFVANDGHAFSTTNTINELCDFDKISNVLGLHKADNKEFAGHFGSGFQTVYRITNHPEIHSSGRTGKMNPSIKQWTFKEEELKSPYEKSERKGTLFVFPWRDDKKALEDGGVWKQMDKWPRWDRQKRRAFFDSLKEYIHQAFLCCKTIKTVRLIWHENSSIEGYQASRDFKLRKNDNETLDFSCRTGTVTEGLIEPEHWTNEWDDSFQQDSWHYSKNSRRFSYLIGERNVSDNGRIYIGKRKDGYVTISKDKDELEKDLKRGDLFVLFPLFDVTKLFEHEGRSYLYSVIPLPGRSKNRFIFTGHFWPTEDRRDVNVEGMDGVYGKWYQTLMLNVIGLYEWLFDRLLEKLNSNDMPDSFRQTILLNNLPTVELSEWMRPGKENNQEWLKESQIYSNQLSSELIKKPLLYSNGVWEKPLLGFWTADEMEKDAFDSVEALTFSATFVEHPSFRFLQSKLEDRKANPTKFVGKFLAFSSYNKDFNGLLKYGQKLKSGKILDRTAINSLINYCIIGDSGTRSNLLLAVVPGSDSVLRSIKEYPVFDNKFEFVYDFLPKSALIHNDFKSAELLKAKDKFVEHDELIGIIDKIIRNNPDRFKVLSLKDHQILSQILKMLVESGWTPKEGLIESQFIPYRLGNNCFVGTLNVKGGMHKEWISYSHVGENYEPDSIFGIQTQPIPGLTEEVKAKIKFIEILDSNDEIQNKIERVLQLEKLQETFVPTNFVRHFLSNRHESSLFQDQVLREFLNSDQIDLDFQKREFLKALQIYFKKGEKTEIYVDRKSMSEVPCLYDEEGKWHNAGEFAINVSPELEVFGYHALHKDFKDWPHETLDALGVDTQPNRSKIAETLKKLEKNKNTNREVLSNIVMWLLASDLSLKPDEIDGLSDDLAAIEWIPTLNGDFKKSKQVLIPTQSNQQLLGNDYSGYLDDSLAKNSFSEDSDWKRITERAQKFKMNLEPELADLLIVVKLRHDANKVASEKIFDMLNQKIACNAGLAEELFRNQKYGYYTNDRWVDSKQIKLMNKKDFPKELLDLFYFLPENHKHSQYLKSDGATSSLLPEDILCPMRSKEITPSMGLWDALNNISSLIDDEELTENSKIYPVNGSCVLPRDIIFKENQADDVILKDGRIGNIHVINRDISGRHSKALRKLGSRSVSELSEQELLSLIRLYKQDNPNLNDPSQILSLLLRITERNTQAVFPDESIWPAEKNAKTIWMNPKQCYFTKDSPLTRYFSELAFLCLKIDGKFKEALKQYAQRSKCPSFEDNLEKQKNIETILSEPDESTTYLIKQLNLALITKYPEHSRYLDWLTIAEVKTSPTVCVTYSIRNIKKQIPIDVYIEKNDSKWIIYLNDASSQALIKQYLSEQITNECINQGFLDSDRLKLSETIYKLVSNRITDWPDIVNGYTLPQVFQNQSHITSLKRAGLPVLEEIFEDPSNLDERYNGYIQTRDTLQSWYECCQICGERTPYEPDSFATMETIKRVIGLRGGLFNDKADDFITDNSILLCPKHQALWVRNLVRFPDLLGDDKEKILNRLKQAISLYESKASINQHEKMQYQCEIVDSLDLRKHGGKPHRSEWQPREITFEMNHFVGFLKTLKNYYEKHNEE